MRRCRSLSFRSTWCLPFFFLLPSLSSTLFIGKCDGRSPVNRQRVSFSPSQDDLFEYARGIHSEISSTRFGIQTVVCLSLSLVASLVPPDDNERTNEIAIHLTSSSFQCLFSQTYQRISYRRMLFLLFRSSPSLRVMNHQRTVCVCTCFGLLHKVIFLNGDAYCKYVLCIFAERTRHRGDPSPVVSRSVASHKMEITI